VTTFQFWLLAGLLVVLVLLMLSAVGELHSIAALARYREILLERIKAAIEEQTGHSNQSFLELQEEVRGVKDAVEQLIPDNEDP
jgi:hypothetical protein